MTLENVLFSVLIEAPASIAIGFLERRFGWPRRRAETVVTAFAISLTLGLCFMAWLFYQLN